MSTPRPVKERFKIEHKTYMEDLRHLSWKGWFSGIIAIIGLITLGIGACMLFTGDIAHGSAVVALGGALVSLGLAMMKDDEAFYVLLGLIALIGAAAGIVTLVTRPSEFITATASLLLFVVTFFAEFLYLQANSRKWRAQVADDASKTDGFTAVDAATEVDSASAPVTRTDAEETPNGRRS
ncbi:hypothetical protein ITJ42_15770 [Clavibacter michiganensis subsp. phaseoli]|uniref:Uncharacterized protein n=1 Tax=Clavibacter phaseoli TaxID=1734031 RepID=A0A8I0SAQ0_9MICO|nr:hypothetical protein [Clavibacter phaseoli]MBF4632677.1 hypothetical protein [Clavibacter phaseoli]